jgi:hypothetical protein
VSVLAAALLCQSLAVFLAAQSVPALATLALELGELPPLSLVQTYRVWVLVPLLSLIAAIDLVRRERVSFFWRTAILTVVLAGALVLPAWLAAGTAEVLGELLEPVSNIK